jgi:hypothetical protein
MKDMHVNCFLFLLAFALGTTVAVCFALPKYSKTGALATLEMLLGQLCTFGGLFAGTLLVTMIFAFIAGKFTT